MRFLRMSTGDFCGGAQRVSNAVARGHESQVAAGHQRGRDRTVFTCAGERRRPVGTPFVGRTGFGWSLLPTKVLALSIARGSVHPGRLSVATSSDWLMDRTPGNPPRQHAGAYPWRSPWICESRSTV